MSFKSKANSVPTVYILNNNCNCREGEDYDALADCAVVNPVGLVQLYGEFPKLWFFRTAGLVGKRRRHVSNRSRHLFSIEVQYSGLRSKKN
jgi:hypothetical protein